MTLEMIQSVIRHLATAFGGWLVGNGTLTGGQVETITGLLVGVAALAWSFFNKKQLRAAPAVK